MLLHDVEELDGDLGGRTDQDLALAHAVGVVDAVHGIGQNACSNHDCDGRGESTRTCTWKKTAREIRFDERRVGVEQKINSDGETTYLVGGRDG